MGEKRALKVVAALLSAASSLATAASTSDCRIDTSQYFVTIGSFGRLPRDSVISLAVRGNLQNGQPVQFSKDEPIVVADLELIRSTPLLVPTYGISYFQEKFLGLKY